MVRQVIQRRLHHCRADAATTRLFLDEHHGNPSHIIENARRYGSHGTSTQLSDKTANWLQIQKSQPVVAGLIPTGFFAQAHPQWYVGRGHRSNSDHKLLCLTI